MALIWKPNYTTGVKELDEQHRQIIDQLNRLEALIERGISKGPEVDALLAEMGSHVNEHFICEEDCMERHQCPMAEKNKQEHDQFLGLYRDFRADFGKSRSSQTLETFHRAAEQWLLEHVCFVDIHLRSCV